MRRFLALLAILTTTVTAGAGVAPADALTEPQTAPAAVSIPGGFVALTPSRVLDTRSGVGAVVAGGATAAVQVTGRSGVPVSGVSAVVLNVTVTQPTASGFVTVFGAGATRPGVSSLNFVKAQTVPNLVVAPVGVGGKVALYNGSSGSVQLIADVSGYYRSTTASPSPVSGLSATAGNASIRLRWVNPASGSSTGVMIRRSVGSQLPSGPSAGSFVADVAGPTATFTDVGLTSGTKYSYALFAHDAGPAFAVRATVSATTTVTTTPPGPVTTLTATSGNTSITLQWVNPAAGSSTGVMIRRSVGSQVPSEPSGGSFVADVASSSRTFTDSGLVSGTKYSYALFAHDAGPAYATEATVSATTSAPPGPVTWLTASADNTSVALAWVNPPSPAVTGVMIRRAIGPRPPAGPTDGTLVSDVAAPTHTFTDTGLPWKTQYSYALFAHGAAPTYSPGTSVTTTTTDVVVPSFTGTVTDAGGSHSGLTGVRVDVISTYTGDGVSTSTDTDGTWSVTGLSEDTYTVCFFSEDAAGGSGDRYGYVDQCYLNQPTVRTAIRVTATDGTTTTGVDAALVAVTRP